MIDIAWKLSVEEVKLVYIQKVNLGIVNLLFAPLGGVCVHVCFSAAVLIGNKAQFIPTETQIQMAAMS